jgi:hypothetical protein
MLNPAGRGARGIRARRNRPRLRLMPSRPTDIDLIYGLEPVFEPGEEAGSDALEQFLDVACPYCAELILVRVDLTGGSQSYVEDCQVCCQPIQFAVSVGHDGGLSGFAAARMDR